MNLPSHSSVLLQNQLNQTSEWLQFDNPKEQIVARSPAEILPCFERLQQKQEEGYYLAGYLAYEAAAGLNAAMANTKKIVRSDYPLLWFGAYTKPKSLSTKDLISRSQLTSISQAPASGNLQWQPDISLEHYANALARIKEEIAEGNTYQVNYTFRMLSKFELDPFTFFLTLQRAQSSLYSAYINLGDVHICSASPELFFTLKGGQLQARPMKGTINRGLHSQQDMRRRNWLQTSEKNRAENLMIVDMIRNDLGQVALSGSVVVDELFSIETYPTVLQMTSSISAKTNCSALEVLQHMFPCASITGAPKISTMNLISELESSPRGAYTGSIGYISPQGDAQFNVAIRSVVVDKQKKLASFGVGGGIVWDSTVEDEFRECKIKAEILMREPPGLKLLESLRMDANGEIYLLEEHLQRLENACAYFGFKFNEKKIRQLIQTTQKSYAGDAHKLRLLVDPEGVPEMTAIFLGSKLHYRVVLSDKKSNTQSRFVYHKTTNRTFYDELLAECQADDVIIVNADGNITESCYANVVIVKDGKRYTPALDCGLLNGTLRKKLVDSGELQEAVISLQEFQEADEIYLLNSVRGWMKLKFGDDNIYIIVEEEMSESKL